MSFSFIHAADLHLDSPFIGVTAVSATIADSLRSATFESFNALIDLCIEKQVQFLLVSGDVYDGEDRSLRAQFHFRNGLKKLVEHNIQAFVVHGNHDPYKGHTRSIAWPEGIHVFDYRKVESVSVEVDDIPVAIISGISHETKNVSKNLAKKFEKSDSDLFHIGLLHCNVGTDTGHEAYSPCILDDLVGLDFNYWALGHVHEKKILHKNPYIVYPGNTQGRNIREQAERGCYLVQVDDDNQVSSLDFQELDVVRWFQGNLSIDGLETIDQLENLISEYLDSILAGAGNRAVISRIILSGQGPLFKELSKENALQDLLEYSRENYEIRDPFARVQDIKFHCKPEIDLDKRRNNPDFLGQVLRISQKLSESKEGEILLRENGLNELFQNKKLSKILSSVSKEDAMEMLRAAEILCYQILEEEY